MLKQKAKYEELGYTDCSEIKDRFYFHSMYTRSPGGILIECTSNVPGGFYQDEAPDELGTKLLLPPWYEDQRGDRCPARADHRPGGESPQAGRDEGAGGGAGGAGPQGRIGPGVGRAALALPGEIRRQEVG